MASTKLANRVLIANRGEIAIRIARTARELAVNTVAIHAEDEVNSLHLHQADEVHALKGMGAAAYLDQSQLIEAAKATGCDAVHPGYGFLSENAEFAARCRDEGLAFIGPSVAALRLFGDKIRARAIAEEAGVPVLPASNGAMSLDEATEFFKSLGDDGAMLIKAVGGGGGRGMRVVKPLDDLEEALNRCASEAKAAFGNGDLYVESLVTNALHIEVQIVADSKGAVSHIHERDCSLQRRHQKLIEIAPSPQLTEPLRTRIHDAAVQLASRAGYDNIGTFEFLVDGADLGDQSAFYFIEANPRLQVEHTVTEEVTGIDLVRVQFEIAGGATLAEIGLTQDAVPAARGYSMQLRINMESISPDGVFRPTGGRLDAFEPPSGPGVRVDTFGYAGYETSPHYDSLLAKVIASTSRNDFDDVIRRARRALTEFRIDGVATNIGFLEKVLDHDRMRDAYLTTDFIDEDVLAINALENEQPRRHAPGEAAQSAAAVQTAGATLDASDPLAVLAYGKTGPRTEMPTTQTQIEQEGMRPVIASMQATVVSLAVQEGDLVAQGQELMVLNAMKMEHVLTAEISGAVRNVTVKLGDTLAEGSVLLYIEEAEVEQTDTGGEVELDLENPRPDLAEVIRRRALTTDASRKKQAEKRHQQGARTARENVYDLCDEGTFLQYGSLAFGQGLHGTVDELLDYAPSDAMVMGLCHVNGHLFGPTESRCVAMCYDYSVLAGTQGGMHHKLLDRMFKVADKLESPVVLFTEGGGGRAGSGSRPARRGTGGSPVHSGGGGLKTTSWTYLSYLSGRVPLIGINAGFCFAGNTVLLGCCDVIIATANSSIGMGGPAMIEGGGLGVYRPEEVGPMSVQVPNGVVDIAVADEAEAVEAAKRYLSYFQGDVKDWECADQRLLRHAIPENRLRVYDIRKLIETMADTDSLLELRAGFGLAMVTAFARIEGHPVGIVANNPTHLSGAIDSDAADKAARFMKLCDAFNIPLVMLCDTPGIMVGPEAEKDGLARHSARMFLIGASLTVPFFLVILRKAYGLGGQAMGGGTHNLPSVTVAWPTSEFGGMGLEGQVKLGHIATLEAIEDPAERQAMYEKLVEQAYDRGQGLNAGHVLEVDDVIDPADTRRWVIGGLSGTAPARSNRTDKKICIDAW
jgi:acetyl/propionyl-CoA carboxylase alpha subunit/acetyl-CoA carboxylase carboxyltransferase component